MSILINFFKLYMIQFLKRADKDYLLNKVFADLKLTQLHF